jgi:hypothetical protein
MVPGRRLGPRQVLLTPSLSLPEGRSTVNLDDVRKLELSYSRRTPGEAELVVEYVGGRIKLFEVKPHFTSRVSYRVREDRNGGNVREHRI